MLDLRDVVSLSPYKSVNNRLTFHGGGMARNPGLGINSPRRNPNRNRHQGSIEAERRTPISVLLNPSKHTISCRAVKRALPHRHQAARPDRRLVHLSSMCRGARMRPPAPRATAPSRGIPRVTLPEAISIFLCRSYSLSFPGL